MLRKKAIMRIIYTGRNSFAPYSATTSIFTNKPPQSLSKQSLIEDTQPPNTQAPLLVGLHSIPQSTR